MGSPPTLLRYFLLLAGLLLFAGIKLLPAQASFSLNTGDCHLHYRIFGEGSPVLVINGGPGMDCAGFAGMASRLGKHHRVILFDQRGTGTSSVEVLDSNSINMEAMVSDMEALRTHLGYKRWSVLGHSFGGMLGAYYATLHPKSIDRLVLSSSGGVDLRLLDDIAERLQGNLAPGAGDSIAYWDERMAAGDTSRFARARRATALATAYVYDQKYVAVIAERLQQSNPAVNRLVWQDLQRIGFDCKVGLRKFKRPVLIVQGRNDILAPEIVERTRAALPQSRVVWLDHCAHYGWLDRPEAYWEAVEGFLGE